ncbi:MAG: hypothetical protein WA030_03975 [Candidatus Microsaccharimonas sp.]
MKKVHIRSLKFHTIYSVSLAIVFFVVMMVVRDLMLGIALVLLLAYVVGNGIIHGKKNQLTRDGLFEYVLLSLIVVILILGVLFTH